MSEIEKIANSIAIQTVLAFQLIWSRSHLHFELQLWVTV